MAERFRQIVDRIVEKWKSWSAKQKTIIISMAAVILVAVAIIAFAVTRPNYEVLTTCQDYTELGSVTSILNENGYKYQVQDNTLVVKVEKKNLTNAKMAIASADIKSDGYTFDDAMKSSFTTTESDKTKQFAHYLEAKFVSDLESMDGIKSASVSVDIPDTSSSFYATTAEKSVSVVVDTNKTISDDTAESIANFLATAAGNSTTNNITIIDNKGTTLFSGLSNAGTVSGVSNAGKQKYKAQIEATTINSLRKGLLSTGLYDDVNLTLNYVLDWDAVNTIATEYSTQGDEQAIFGESYEEISTGSTGASGTPGTTSNSSDSTTYNVTNGTGDTSTYQLNKYSYMPNSLVTTTNKEPGSIVYGDSSLAVTFIKNVVYNEDECKKLGYLDNMTWEQFKSQNTQPVAQTVDQTWIDLISAGTGIDSANISVLAYQRPWFEDSTSGSVFTRVTFWLQIALAAIILGILVFVIIRSARPLTVEETEPELSVEQMLAATKENQPAVDDIDMQDKSETRKAIEKFVDENPEAVALLLRNWLNDDWS